MRPGESAGVVAVLLVDDDEDDYLITRHMLGDQDRSRFSVEWVAGYHEALVAIRERRHDVYLIDYRLGERTGLDLVREGFAASGTAPFILLTSESDYSIDLEASGLGVTDFLLKQELSPQALERSVRYAISHHQALRDLAVSEERYALAASAVNDGIWDWDIETGHFYCSPRWYALLGLPDGGGDEQLQSWLGRVHAEDLEGVRRAMDVHLSGGSGLLQAEHRMRHDDGTWRWMLARGMAVRDAAGRPTRMAGSLSDITLARRTALQLQHDAMHDALTGLPNRALFMDRLDQAIASHARDPVTSCAVLFLDLDRFKLVNDTFSHAAGDKLLVGVAERISAQLRRGDTVARISGDEFTILVDDLRMRDAEADAILTATRIQAGLADAFYIDGHRLFVTASTGIAVASGGMTASDVVRSADIAMYEAKHGGRDRYAVFDESMHRRIAHRLSRESDLRDVVERSLICVHYQPVVELATGTVRGFEALARWPDQLAPLSPTEFIPIAEETGLIGELGRQVLHSALRTLASWRRSGLVSEDVRMSVNISGRQLDDPRFPDQVLEAVEAHRLPGEALRLEITEGTLMREPKLMGRVMSEVSVAGVGLELDDFGTGYSSLGALHQFPVNALKIDRSFISSLVAPGDSETIVRSTVALAHNLGLEVVAEGIEHPDQLEHLRELSCDHGQGFLFSKPLPAAEIEDALREWPEGHLGLAIGGPAAGAHHGR